MIFTDVSDIFHSCVVAVHLTGTAVYSNYYSVISHLGDREAVTHIVHHSVCNSFFVLKFKFKSFHLVIFCHF